MTDVATDYDIFDPGYVVEPYPVWAALRQRCPVAHTDRWGGSWLPTRYDDVVAFARDVEHFSSESVTVTPAIEGVPGIPADIKAPPITSDPPEHHWARRLILPVFAPQAVARYEPYTRELCASLAAEIAARGAGDGAAQYAQYIPVRVISKMLGVDESMADDFTGWIRGALEFGLTDPKAQEAAFLSIFNFLTAEIATRQAAIAAGTAGDDIISYLLQQTVDGEPVLVDHVLGTCVLILVAGIDTTWSSIGSAIWHLATHPEDRRRLVADPSLVPVAVEELLRAYSPVTMARLATSDVEFAGCPISKGDRILMSFPAANRDPEQFEDPDTVIIDREVNRHVAFGVGIHRCAGSNLARMELRIAVEEWLKAIPECALAEDDETTWAGGQVRGPRHLPIVITGGAAK
ncbi:cytochrome P450 [Acidiferrimicrobium sp. IK]|uniref:cytochrome P450 n=1 Tax=Acidiferrimicrobium sp. IK TaxID=2871700 RepID=UPI0021CB3868|nr:cytochrome P450 [Acidiferrimicrobium sp. IK]MCU4187469.1 cytochrome P450 [Acidiferrimicrobium sp. IK]